MSHRRGRARWSRRLATVALTAGLLVVLTAAPALAGPAGNGGGSQIHILCGAGADPGNQSPQVFGQGIRGEAETLNNAVVSAGSGIIGGIDPANVPSPSWTYMVYWDDSAITDQLQSSASAGRTVEQQIHDQGVTLLQQLDDLKKQNSNTPVPGVLGLIDQAHNAVQQVVDHANDVPPAISGTIVRLGNAIIQAVRNVGALRGAPAAIGQALVNFGNFLVLVRNHPEQAAQQAVQAIGGSAVGQVVGHAWDAFVGGVTNFAFRLATDLVGVQNALVRWAYEVRVWNQLGGPACRMAANYQEKILNRLHLPEFFLLLGAAYAAWFAFRGRTTRAAGELGTSLVIFAILAVFLSRPLDVFNQSFHIVESLSQLTLSGGQAGPDPLNQYELDIHKALVAEPYDALNWGRVLQDGRDDADIACRNKLLADTKNAPTPLVVADNLGVNPPLFQRVKDDWKACPNGAAYVSYAAQASVDRAIGATILLLSTALIVLAVIVLAFLVILHQIEAVLLLAIAPFALVTGLLGGPGRGVFWRFIDTFIKDCVGIVVLAALLSFLSMSLRFFLEASDGLPLLLRFLWVFGIVAIIVLWKGWAFHEKPLRLIRRLAARADYALRPDNWTRPELPIARPWAHVSHVPFYDLTVDAHQSLQVQRLVRSGARRAARARARAAGQQGP